MSSIVWAHFGKVISLAEITGGHRMACSEYYSYKNKEWVQQSEGVWEC